MPFVGLHNHTHYSNFRLRDSINRVPELIEYAHELGHKGVAITDHETIASSLEAQKYFHQKSKESGWEDFKLILGNEIYLCDSSVNEENKDKMIFPHFILLALDEEGHKQIRQLSTRAWSRSFSRNNMMRVPTYYEDLEEFIYSNRGHVIGSTACIGGTLPRMLLAMRNNPNADAIYQEMVSWIRWMDETFGHGNFFFELQPSEHEEQLYVNKELLSLSKQFDIKCIITTDSHYLKKDDLRWQSIFLNADKDSDREADEFYATTYVMSEEEIHNYLDDALGAEIVRECMDNTMLIHARVKDYDLTRPLQIPYLPLNTAEPDTKLAEKYIPYIPLLKEFLISEYASDRHLVRDIVNKLESDPRLQYKESYDAIQVCLEYISASSEKMNVRWSAYLLQEADLVRLAWEAGTIVGPGRGSGVGFYLLYLLEITQINPLWEKTRTFPWRFLNPERASVLDIDVDICGDKREAVVSHFKEVYGADRVSKVMTLSTEKGRSAIQTVARGLGYDNDLAFSLGALIVSDRGTPRTLIQMYYGDRDYDADPRFIEEMDKYPDIRDAAFKIEGLIKGVGSHAGGIIITDHPFTDVTALMKTNSGDIITQYDLHMCEDVSLIKSDLLSVEGLDKIRTCLELLLEQGKIEWQGSLKNTYEKYIGVYNLERDDPEMWKMLWEHKVVSFFQMEQQSGIQAVALCKPDSVDSLATINSVMRLMAQSENAESPINKYARFKKDITEWYKEMEDYGLTQEEQDILKEILSESSGICEAQEYLVLLTSHPKIGGFSLGWGDKLRKAVAKKKPKEFLELQKEFFQNAKEKHLSKNLTDYVWNVLIMTQRQYGFNRSHTLAYSIIGLQDLNLAYRYPIIYWNCANLIVDSGSTSSAESSSKSTDYGKIATAISQMQHRHIKITPPLINSARFGFFPDEENNRIIYALKAINGIGDDVVRLILEHQPYASFDDFCDRMIKTGLVKKSQMIQLIKAGCFMELDDPDRRKTMKKYIDNYVVALCSKLTFSQFDRMIYLNSKYPFIPQNVVMGIRHKYFSDYVLAGKWKPYIDSKSKRKLPKCGYNDRHFVLDQESMAFFKEYYTDNSVVGVQGENYVISEKLFKKENEVLMSPLKDFMNSDRGLAYYNMALETDVYKENASGSIPKWEMDSLSIYVEHHILEKMPEQLYGVSDFNQLPAEPEAYDYYTRTVTVKNAEGIDVKETKRFPKYKITRLAGTIIDKDKDKHMLALLTTHGVVTCKLNKGQYLYYDRQINEIDNKGKKTRVEKSWFTRGNNILICGHRDDNLFRVHKYADTVYTHCVCLISDIHDDGTIETITERAEVA